ncbi:NAD(P)-binding protein [Rhodococcus sp. G-MC3]|uniref:NAD(P)/FAD-dependent oxidoreductase n=1 Tax=Rhodococcus sp. G-MC3 TaxID=3046209 RepID=UPI0024B96EE3|nr:NAD(P)-binding protein [Rhodococcus sp. G-MC3]MDJ0392987.1 NAD(P)-binding protein [Rhodococcus sp. G-MC3]
MSTPPVPVSIVGAGIAGAACAVALRDAGVPFRLIDRGRAVGGRMASPELHGRRVDVGAGYFTVRDDEFAEVVAGWESAGLAQPWTETFGVLAEGAEPRSSTGPVRWATPGGLRSLVRDLLTDIPFLPEHVTEMPDGDVLLAMPDPQAQRLTSVPDAVGYDPVLSVVFGFEELALPFEHAAFVNEHPVVAFVADDGSRRGDGAPVLVVHTTATFANEHISEPAGAVDPIQRSIRELLDLPAPLWSHAHRWTFGKPVESHGSNYGLTDTATGTLGFAGDQWCATGSPRVESAWRSGTELGRAYIRLRR